MIPLEDREVDDEGQEVEEEAENKQRLISVVLMRCSACSLTEVPSHRVDFAGGAVYVLSDWNGEVILMTLRKQQAVDLFNTVNEAWLQGQLQGLGVEPPTEPPPQQPKEDAAFGNPRRM